MEYIVPFSTAFPREFVPRGCRNGRIEYPLVAAFAVVRNVTSEQAPAGFRISFPSGPLHNGNEKGDRAPVELPFFDGCVWWPWAVHCNFAFPEALVTAGAWRDSVGAHLDLVRCVPVGDRHVATESAARESFPDRRNEIVAQVQRALYENYLVRGDTIYVRGGIPLYAYAEYPRSGRPWASVVSASTSRRLETSKPLYQPPGAFEHTETQSALCDGRFCLPGQEGRIPKAASASKPLPRIEVAHPDLMQGVSSNSIRLDCLFHETLRELDFVLHSGRKPKIADWMEREKRRRFAVKTKAVFRQAIEPAADDAVTDARRFGALDALFGTRRKLPRRVHLLVAPLMRGFEQLERPKPVVKLAAEDVEALAGLAG
jgi:hypothetical protein